MQQIIKKVFKNSIFLFIMALFAIILFACQKATYEPNGANVTYFRLNNIKLKYNQEGEHKYYYHVRPYKNNGDLDIKLGEKIGKIMDIEINNHEYYFILKFKTDIDKDIDKTPKDIIIVNDKNGKEIAKVNIDISKNNTILQQHIKILTENLVSVSKTNQKDPNKLKVNKKYILYEKYDELKKLLSEAQKVYSRHESEQNEIDEQTAILKKCNEDFNKDIIIGKKEPEWSFRGSIMAISLFVFFVAISLLLLLILFVFKNKNKKNKEKIDIEDIPSENTKK